MWYTRIIAVYGQLGPGHKDSMAMQGPPGFAVPDSPVKVYDGCLDDADAMERFRAEWQGDNVAPRGAKYRVERVWVEE